jgi:hypothetical protein
LNLDERRGNAGSYALYRALLHERRHDPVLKLNDRARTHAEAIGVNAIAMHRWLGDRRRLLIANFGHTLTMPLGDLAGRTWTRILSTTEPRFGGSDQPIEIDPSSITIPARSAALFAAD